MILRFYNNSNYSGGCLIFKNLIFFLVFDIFYFLEGKNVVYFGLYFKDRFKFCKRI